MPGDGGVVAVLELFARQILDSAGDAFVSTDAAGVVTGWNEQAEALFGWSRDEAVGCPVSELIISEAYRADHDEGVRRFLETGEPKVRGQRLELEALRLPTSSTSPSTW